MEYSKEELLAEAKKRYPIGTKFLDASGDKYYPFVEVSKFKESDKSWYTNKHVIVYCKQTSHRGYYLYYAGKWATIISTPEPKLIYNYQIL